ncbi:Interphotoreceptor matrix proteoglycan 2, partial [Dissostichus eleginoides]
MELDQFLKRNILFPSGVRLCSQETFEQAVKNHQNYFQLRICQETVTSDISREFSQSERHAQLIRSRLQPAAALTRASSSSAPPPCSSESGGVHSGGAAEEDVRTTRSGVSPEEVFPTDSGPEDLQETSEGPEVVVPDTEGLPESEKVQDYSVEIQDVSPEGEEPPSEVMVQEVLTQATTVVLTKPTTEPESVTLGTNPVLDPEPKDSSLGITTDVPSKQDVVDEDLPEIPESVEEGTLAEPEEDPLETVIEEPEEEAEVPSQASFQTTDRTIEEVSEAPEDQLRSGVTSDPFVLILQEDEDATVEPEEDLVLIEEGTKEYAEVIPTTAGLPAKEEELPQGTAAVEDPVQEPAEETEITEVPAQEVVHVEDIGLVEEAELVEDKEPRGEPTEEDGLVEISEETNQRYQSQKTLRKNQSLSLRKNQSLSLRKNQSLSLRKNQKVWTPTGAGTAEPEDPVLEELPVEVPAENTPSPLVEVPAEKVEATTKYVVEYNNGNFPALAERPLDLDLFGNSFGLEDEDSIGNEIDGTLLWPPRALKEQVVELSLKLRGETFSDALRDPSSTQYQLLDRHFIRRDSVVLEVFPSRTLWFCVVVLEVFPSRTLWFCVVVLEVFPSRTLWFCVVVLEVFPSRTLWFCVVVLEVFPSRTLWFCVVVLEVFPKVFPSRTLWFCVVVLEVFPSRTLWFCVVVLEVFPKVFPSRTLWFCVVVLEVFPSRTLWFCVVVLEVFPSRTLWFCRLSSGCISSESGTRNLCMFCSGFTGAIQDALERLPGFRGVRVVEFRPQKDLERESDYSSNLPVKSRLGLVVLVLYSITLEVDGSKQPGGENYPGAAEQPTMVYTITDFRNYITEALHKDGFLATAAWRRPKL